MSDFGYYPVNDSDGAALPKIDDLDECFICRIFDDYTGSCTDCDSFKSQFAKLEDQFLCDRYNNAVDQLIDDLPF